MLCQWEAYLRLVPPSMRREVDRLGKEAVRELRLRLGQPATAVLDRGRRELSAVTAREDIQHVINCACRYSPWASTTVTQGYLTGPGGHRVGVTGQALLDGGRLTGIRDPVCLCLRRAADFPGIARELARLEGSILIIGPPGSGKTTLLRDLIRTKSSDGSSTLGVVDQRGELFPPGPEGWGYPTGKATDVLWGCPREEGMEMLLRTMTPTVLAVDEISSEQDCLALVKAAWCGVALFATAHAGSPGDLRKRPVYKSILSAGLFDHLVWLRGDGTRTVERMDSWRSS